MITQKQWLEIQLIAVSTTLALRNLDDDLESISTSVEGDAISVSFRRTSVREHSLENNRWEAASNACGLLVSVSIPDWAKELHLELHTYAGGRNSRVSMFTRTRVALSSLDRRCGTMVGLKWSPPTPTQSQAASFSDLALSVARQPEGSRTSRTKP